MEHVDINYLAVVVCALSSMLIGAIWYGPVFGKLWMKAEGLTEEEIKKDFNPGKTYGLAVLGHVVVAYVISRLMGYVDVTTLTQALRLTFLVWLGFSLAPMGIHYLFERKTLKLYFINSFYNLVVFVIFTIILFYWN